MRRARRLLPALVTVVAVSVAAARVVDADLLVNIRRQVLGAITFSTNWVEIVAGADYFDQSTPSLFVTFWSLAVEEQFYIVWPIAFVALTKRFRDDPLSECSRLWPLPMVVAVGSAALMAALFEPGASSTRVYYGTDTHVFGIMIGVALAFAYSGPVTFLRSWRWRRARRWLGPFALVALVVLAVVLDSESTFTYRGGIFVASLLTALAVATLPGQRTAFVGLLHARVLVWIGQRSYGIYLWHWPVLLIVSSILPPTAPGDSPSWLAAVLALSVTFALSAASYEWIEMPVIREGFGALAPRRRHQVDSDPDMPARLQPLRAILGVTGLAVAAMAVVGIVTAPRSSKAELAVEAGQAAMAKQSALDTTTSTTSQVTESYGSPMDTAGKGVDSDEVTTTSEAPLAWPGELAIPPGDHIVGFGDSVMSGAAPALYQRFPGIYLDAKPIRQWRDAPGLIQPMIDAGTMRNVVVLNFGTNAGLISAESQNSLISVLDALGPQRRILIVTVVGVSKWVPETNAKLHEIVAPYPNIAIVEWHDVVQAQPGLLHKDRTHPNMDGIKVYADAIASALGQLGPG